MGDLNNNGLKMFLYILHVRMCEIKKINFLMMTKKKQPWQSGYTELYRIKLCYIKWINLLFSFLIYTWLARSLAFSTTPLAMKKKLLLWFFFCRNGEWTMEKFTQNENRSLFLCRQCKSTYIMVCRGTPANSLLLIQCIIF